METSSLTPHAAEPSAQQPSRGRPRKSHPKSPAERTKAYRERLKTGGLREVKCYLSPEHLAYLKALCELHQVAIADAVGMALTALIRGEAPRASFLEAPQKTH